MKRILSSCLAAILVLASFTFAFADDEVFRTATGVCVNEGNVYIVEQDANRVVKLAEDFTTREILSGNTFSDDVYGEAYGGYLDGVNKFALYNKPTGIVKYSNGYAVSDTENNVVRFISKTKTHTLSGNGEAKLQDGTGEGASFNHPTGLAIDPSGNLYIADTGNDAIRMMTTDGKVTTIVTGLAGPRGLAWLDGVLYIADSGNQRILQYTSDDKKVWMVAGDTSWTVENVEGNPVAGGYVDGNVKSARFSNPVGLAADNAAKVLYVGDCGNNAIRIINLGSKTVSTLLAADARNLDKFPSEPVGLYVEGNKLYVADATAGVYVVELTGKHEMKKANVIFGDVPETAWFNKAVSYAYSNGLFNGTSDNAFSPNAAMTRGMFVTVISRLNKLNNPQDIIGGDTVFGDVSETAYYANATSWAADNGIVSGIGGGSFAPGSSITRSQMATIIYNYAKMAGANMTITDKARSAMSAMQDSASVEAYAADAFAWAMGHGIINGKGGRLAPRDTATRAEVAQIVYNFANANMTE